MFCFFLCHLYIVKKYIKYYKKIYRFIQVKNTFSIFLFKAIYKSLRIYWSSFSGQHRGEQVFQVMVESDMLQVNCFYEPFV